jgi:hypothetical protein
MSAANAGSTSTTAAMAEASEVRSTSDTVGHRYNGTGEEITLD